MTIKNSLRLYLYIFILAMIQVIINNNSSLYLDLLGIVVVALILSGNYTLTSLFILSFASDLIGHWYLGTHLIAAISLTFVSKSVINYFSISTFLHKSITLIFFSCVFLLLIFCIDLLVHNAIIGIASLIINVLITPIIFKFLDKFLTIPNKDLLF